MLRILLMVWAVYVLYVHVLNVLSDPLYPEESHDGAGRGWMGHHILSTVLNVLFDP